MTITRRALLASAPALSLLAMSGAKAYEFTDYTAETLAAAKASGRPFILDFFATWCTTCAAQHRVIEGLIAANPAYAGVTIIQVDWDQNLNGPLVASLQIPRRSTLLVMKGDTELMRLVAGTGEAEIAALFTTALAAA